MVIINSEERNVAGKILSEYLADENYNCKHIAVERNGEIVPKREYDKTLLQEGDKLEIVRFVGGG